MCTGAAFPAWQARCIEALLAEEGAELVLLIVDDQPPRSPSRRRGAVRRPGETALWRLYERLVLDRVSRASRMVDLSPALGRLPVVRCRADPAGTASHRFRSSDLEAIRRHDLDVLLQFAFEAVGGEILTIPRFGVWSFHHGDPDRDRGSPPAFWEIYHGEPMTAAVLQRLADPPGAAAILHRGAFRAIPHSHPRSRDDVLFGSADWPARVCRDIRNGTARSLGAPHPARTAATGRAPGNLPMMRFGWKWARAWLHDQLTYRQWNVGVIHAPVHEVLGLPAGSPSGVTPGAVHWLPERAGRFLADPFAVARPTGGTGAMTILAEEYDWTREQGHIAIVESSDGRTFGHSRPAIKLACHMSYPFLVEHEGATYCIPETYQAGEVALYRAGSSLQEWAKVATLIPDFPGVDSTVFHHDGRWWLFCTSTDAGDNTKLFAWYADELTGPWTPHAANPLKTDVRSSRPAGVPFVHEGRLYRPAQDCSIRYGAAVAINRVDMLTPEAFSEEVVTVLRPDPASRYSNGLHTICAVGDYTVIDGARQTFVKPGLAPRFLHRLKTRIQGERNP